MSLLEPQVASFPKYTQKWYEQNLPELDKAIERKENVETGLVSTTVPTLHQKEQQAACSDGGHLQRLWAEIYDNVPKRATQMYWDFYNAPGLPHDSQILIGDDGPGAENVSDFNNQGNKINSEKRKKQDPLSLSFYGMGTEILRYFSCCALIISVYKDPKYAKGLLVNIVFKNFLGEMSWQALSGIRLHEQVLDVFDGNFDDCSLAKALKAWTPIQTPVMLTSYIRHCLTIVKARTGFFTTLYGLREDFDVESLTKLPEEWLYNPTPLTKTKRHEKLFMFGKDIVQTKSFQLEKGKFYQFDTELFYTDGFDLLTKENELLENDKISSFDIEPTNALALIESKAHKISSNEGSLKQISIRVAERGAGETELLTVFAGRDWTTSRRVLTSELNDWFQKSDKRKEANVSTMLDFLFKHGGRGEESNATLLGKNLTIQILIKDIGILGKNKNRFDNQKKIKYVCTTLSYVVKNLILSSVQLAKCLFINGASAKLKPINKAGEKKWELFLCEQMPDYLKTLLIECARKMNETPTTAITWDVISYVFHEYEVQRGHSKRKTEFIKEARKKAQEEPGGDKSDSDDEGESPDGESPDGESPDEKKISPPKRKRPLTPIQPQVRPFKRKKPNRKRPNKSQIIEEYNINGLPTRTPGGWNDPEDCHIWPFSLNDLAKKLWIREYPNTPYPENGVDSVHNRFLAEASFHNRFDQPTLLNTGGKRKNKVIFHFDNNGKYVWKGGTGSSCDHISADSSEYKRWVKDPTETEPHEFDLPQRLMTDERKKWIQLFNEYFVDCKIWD